MLKPFAYFTIGLTLAFPAYAETVKVSDDVAALVVPVLSARSKSAAHDTEKNAEALDRALSPILEKRTAQTTEALAVLLGYYIGEHPGEDVSCELVARGKEAEAPLEKYAQAKIILPGSKRFKPRSVQSEYPIVLRRIKAHEQCVREP